MKTAHTALSLGLAVVIALSVFAMPATFYGFRQASAQTVLTMDVSTDDHGNKFFGNGMAQVLIEDSSTDDSGDSITVSVEVRDDTGSSFGNFPIVVPDTTVGSQRFEMFLANGTDLTPQDPEGAGTVTDIGAGGTINIGEALADGFTIKVTYKTLSRTITYTDTPANISTDRESYGSDSILFLTIDDQDANVDPTHRDVVNATSGFVTMDGAASFANVACDETGDNSAEFECDYVIGTDITMSASSTTLAISVRDASQYKTDSASAGLIDAADAVSLVLETGTDDVSVSVEDSDGELSDPGAITFSSELSLHLTDPDRNISSKSGDDIVSTQGAFNPGVNDITDLDGMSEGVVVYVDASGGDFEAVPMTEDADNTGVFVPDLANDELKISFLSNGETAVDNNGILELTSADVNEDIIIAYVDPAPDTDPLSSTLTKELTTVAGKLTVDDTAGINSDFTLTITDADLNNNPNTKDIYTLNFTNFGPDCDTPASCNAITEDATNVEFGLFRGGHNLGNADGNALYETVELQVAGVNIDLLGPFTESLSETGPDTGIFTASFDMQDILTNADNGDTVDDGDTLEFTLNDYMEDTKKASSDEITVGRATAGVDLSRDEAPIPPASVGPSTPIFDAIGSATVSIDLQITDDDVNENTGSQDTLTLDLAGAGQNFRVEVDAAGFDANSDDDGIGLAGALDGNDLADIFTTNGGALEGLTLEETGANTGVFEETLDFVRGPISLDDWQDMRITFVYIQPDGDEDSSGVTFRGHDGIVDVDVPSVKSHTMMTVNVQDEDLNLDSTNVEEFDCGFAATELLRFEAENDDIAQSGNCATFTETGEDTGIFTGQLEVGTDLEIVSGEDQASNLHITYQDEIDSSGENGDDIEVDVPVVSGTGAIQVKPDLVGPGTEITVLITDTDLDEKPSGKDTIKNADQPDLVQIRSDRREVSKTGVDMEETGPSTGVFQFTIQLITNAQDCADDDLSDPKYDASFSGDKAEIGACPGDLVALKYEDAHDASGRSQVVSKVVEVNSWDPEFKADKDSYNVGDKATVTIADPDANRDADVADTLRDIRITSTSDQVGEEVSAIETGKDTGVFKLSFGLSGSATSGGINVKKGDTVTITYTDDFPANFVDIENDKDFKFTLSVSGTGASPTATTPSAPVAKDITGKVVTSVTTGQQVLLATTIINTLDQDLPYVALIEVRDSSGVTVAIGFSTGTLKPNDRNEVGQSFTPQESGSYNVRTFVISSLDKPQILSKVEQSTLSVS